MIGKAKVYVKYVWKKEFLVPQKEGAFDIWIARLSGYFEATKKSKSLYETTIEGLNLGEGRRKREKGKGGGAQGREREKKKERKRTQWVRAFHI